MTEEHYQDGIKLPTDNDISTWKEKVGANVTFARAKIEGGYLYYLLEGDGVCFVPDNNMQNHINNSDDMLKHIADLSIKLNAMQDSLREFEKEKVAPIAKELKGEIAMRQDLRDYCFDTLGDNIRILEDRLIAQKADHEITKSSLANIYEKIHKLEEHHARQIDENRKVFNHLDHLDYSKNKIVERIEKLELALSKLNNGKDEKVFPEFSHPRAQVQLCPHGLPISIKAGGINCTACY